ncbi:MAG: peptidoglycan-binding protein [Gammaproteobacteria bacterium]|nr:peptidoglycan-binding protein [Gammaproteobacteria bacterium]MBU1654812.1 peptidoglycan-binding protein [Gammaproteobacteria bacterium]MBU1960553.1 peptidoglycan-binding protein [Gammaproteobacteria bacterium]
MLRNRLLTLLLILTSVTAGALGSWFLGEKIQSPAEMAARTAPPVASPILVPVERRVLSADVVTRGTARFASPQTLAIIPSTLKNGSSVITSLPERNAIVKEGDVLLTASGRPVFALQGNVPAFRDLTPGTTGDNVRLLEEALKRMGFDPGPLDGKYDDKTSAAVAKWYGSAGWEPFGPTAAQRARLRDLEQELAVASNRREAAKAAIASATLTFEAVTAKVKSDNMGMEKDLAAQSASASDTGAIWDTVIQSLEQELAVATKKKAAADAATVSARLATEVSAQNLQKAREYAAKAKQTKPGKGVKPNAAAKTDPNIAVKELEQVLATAGKKQELADAGAISARLEYEVLQANLENIRKRAITEPGAGSAKPSKRSRQAKAKRAGSPDMTQEAAKAAATASLLEGKVAIQNALDAKEAAIREAEIAESRALALAADLEEARKRSGIQIPVDEIVFVPSLPARVEEVRVKVGDPAKGPVLRVTNNQLVVDSALPLDEGPLVKPGMPVAIDEPALRIKAKGVVEEVADTPGTSGVDGYHLYLRIQVTKTPITLEGVSLRLTIPIESTGGEVTAVPAGALHMAADGTSQVQVSRKGKIESLVVEPGLASKGLVEVNPITGKLEPGELVVIGFEHEQ